MNKFLMAILAGACLTLAGGAALAGGDAAAGKAKAEAQGCADCHGDDGKGDEDVPGIAGLSADKFVKAMQEYQSGARTKDPMMAKAAKKLSADDIANLAAYFSAMK
jgi:cytochrome c553